MIRVVLASASPRRRELLSQAGFAFEVKAAHIPEDPRAGEDPIAYVARLAREKAEAVYRELCGENGRHSQPSEKSKDVARAEHPNSHPFRGEAAKWMGHETPGGDAGQGKSEDEIVVLGADTTVTLDGHILGKPEDAEDAARILRMLSGRTHRVMTGVAAVTESRVEVAVEVTAVKFLTLSDEEIAAYIATGEPMDKAGAYGIQGRAARWIPRIEGDYFNVVGLPLALVSTLLEAFGVPAARHAVQAVR